MRAHVYDSCVHIFAGIFKIFLGSATILSHKGDIEFFVTLYILEVKIFDKIS